MFLMAASDIGDPVEFFWGVKTPRVFGGCKNFEAISKECCIDLYCFDILIFFKLGIHR